MKPIKTTTLTIMSLAFVLTFNACKTQAKLTLTPEQQAVKLATGNQATTLELMDTHTSVGTALLTSEYQARVRAVELNAEVAQLISYESYNGYSSACTYRFWKKKQESN